MDPTRPGLKAATALAPLEPVPVGKMVLPLCSGGPFRLLKLKGFLHWKKRHVKDKKYTLRGPIVELENANPSDKNDLHPRREHYSG